MKKLHTISLFMMVLIVSIPFVAAQELSIQQLNGKGSSKGVARTQDELTIEVLVKIPGEDIISNDQVRVYVEDSYAPFDSCTPSTGGYHTCIFREPDFEAYEPIDFTIELRDDDGNIVGSETKTLIADANAPVIKSFSVEPNLTSGQVSVSYVAEDYALLYGSTEQCGGIKSVTITAGNQSVVDSGEGKCIADNTFTLTLQKAGTNQVCATAVDNANYASAPRCKTVRVDKAPPTIEKLSILDEEGFVLTHVHSGEERIATVTVTIADDGGVDGTTVFADFHQLNPTLPTILAPDLSSGDLYSWRDIPVSEVSPCQITVTAKDILGNEARKTFPCIIRADDTPPTVKNIVSEATRGGLPLFGYGAPIVLEIEDRDNTGAEGIGFTSSRVYLDLSALGMSSNAQADGCSRYSGATWRCLWLLTPPAWVAEGTYKITVLADTSDDLGNRIATTADYNIIYDNTGPYPPQIIDFRVITGQQGLEYKGGAVRGNFIQYTVRSANFSTAYANFSDVGGETRTSPTSCTDSGNVSRDCVFESRVDISGPYTAYFTFTFADDANNTAKTNTTLEIYGIDNETNAAYWNPNPPVVCSPSVVDRKTASLIPPIVTCRVDLQTPRQDITTLAISGPTMPDECDGDIELTLNDIYVTNNFENSKNPYLFLKLEPRDYYVNELNINCPISVYSKRAVTTANRTAYYVSPEPQELPVNMTIKFYDNPLGELNQNIDNQIRKAMKKGLADADWISDLRKILHYGELLCQVKVLLTNIISALYLVSIALGITSATLQATGIGAPAGKAVGGAAINTCDVEEAWAGSYEGIIGFLDSVCSLVNCAAVSGKGTGIQAYIGGGMPWCSDMRALWQNLDFTGSGMLDLDVKNSLILSIMCMCLPGIIYNLDKLRQIRCFKAVCLHDDVKLSGYPASFCNEMYGYMMCAFVIGEIFSLIPFAAFFDRLINMVLDLITNPVALFTTAIGTVCTIPCRSIDTAPTGFIACSTLKVVSTVGEAVAAVKTYRKNKDAFGTVGNNWCDRMEDIEDEMEE
ncbi:MAG: hypothetical protein QW165_01995 [Candidatus Woesearchaeota archaeon]